MSKKYEARILVVDDQIEILNLLQLYLSECGYSIELAVNGYDAIDKLACGEYDLVLTDISMPGMCGNRLCDAIRQNHSMPVVAMSANPKSATARFDQVIGKPFLIGEVGTLIKLLLNPKADNVVSLRERGR